VSSWHFNARALESLVELIGQSFVRSGGDMQAGRKLLDLVRDFDIEGNVGAEVLALPRASLPAAAPPVRHRLGRAAALHGYGRRDGAASKGGRSRARRAGSLGHHLHAPAVLGPAPQRSPVNRVRRFRTKPLRGSAHPVDGVEWVVGRTVSAPTRLEASDGAGRQRAIPAADHPSARSWMITDGSRSHGVKLGAAVSSRKRVT
jgi:hypothetical protein